MELMRQLLFERGLLVRDWKSILEIGSRNVNGTYRDLFLHGSRAPVESYVGMDLEPGDGVDLVGNLFDDYDGLSAAGVVPVDLVISGQQLEHDPHPWNTTQAMVRAVAEHGGAVVVIAPWTFPHHHAPDFYRFSPEGLSALFIRAARLELAGSDGRRCSIDADWGQAAQVDAWAVVTVLAP